MESVTWFGKWWQVIWRRLTFWRYWRLCRNSGRVVLIRHADPQGGGTDPSLSAAGVARATELIHVLGDAGVVKIVVSSLKRTQETAAPLATHLGLVPVVVSASDVDAIVAQVWPPVDLVLVVGHSNTVPDVIEQLTGQPMADIPYDEFDNMYVVQHGTTVHLRTAVP